MGFILKARLKKLFHTTDERFSSIESVWAIMILRKIDKFLVCIFITIVVLWIYIPTSVYAQNDTQTSVVVTYYPISGSTLNELLEGKTGEGLLLYSLTENNDLRLAVRLSNPDGADSSAYAEIFEIPAKLQNQPLSISLYQALQKLAPKIILQALNGKWESHGKTDYNLDISIYGPTYAMWGAEYDPESGFQGWAAKLTPDELAVKIQVRDTNADGIPDWDLRQLVPEFPNQGYIRTNYSERKCATPTEVDQGVFPAWPYIVSEGGFEQPSGIFRPPIVVDWETGKITHFSELVTARNQNCSYTIYSINSLINAQINILNFETPFAFYDLSGKGLGYPNFIIRTERYPENDFVTIGRNQPFEQVRYSWRDDVGDWLWDYKVEVLGFHPYKSQTHIANGQYLIDAPDYEEFPSWVMEKPWPLVTFVDTEGNSTKSREGIYDWSPRSFGIDYFFGQASKPNLDEFNAISTGFRGEYRIGEPEMVSLYFSPVDGRMHLKGAQKGLFNLGGGQQIRMYNLDGDDYLDGWTRESISNNTTSAAIMEGLFRLGNSFLYYSKDQLRIYSSEAPDNKFELIPPMDTASWENFNKVMNENTTERKDPLMLSSWMDGIGEEVMRVSHIQVSLPEYSDGIYSFYAFLGPDSQVQGGDAYGFGHVSSGNYLITSDGVSFQIEPLTPAETSLSITSETENVSSFSTLYRLKLTATNTGMADSIEFDARLLADCGGKTAELLRESAVVPGLDVHTWGLDWQPEPGQSCQLIAGLFSPSGAMVSQAKLDLDIPEPRSSIGHAVLNISTQLYRNIPAFVFLVILSLLAGGVTYGLLRRHGQK